MTKRLFLIRLFLCSILSFSIAQISLAQYNDLLDNSNISWLAEFTSDQSLSIQANSSEEIVKLTKLYDDPSNTDYFNRSNWVLDWVYQSAIHGDVKCFTDPGLTQSISHSEILNMVSYIDTVTTFDPATFEEQITIVRGSVNPDDIKSFRLNQVIFYNKKTKNFETRLISVAPILDTPNSKPLFWIKMNEAISKNFDIHSSDISWGALAYSKANPVEFNFMEVRKNENNFDLEKRIYEQAINNEKQIESTEGYGCGTLLLPKEVSNLYTSIDTVITFNPDTYEETIQIIKNDMKPEEVSQLRLVQEWYYNTESKKLINRLKAIAPMVNVTDENGVFKYRKPMYYIRYD